MAERPMAKVMVAPDLVAGTTEESFPIGYRLGRYIIIKRLGEGGMGLVYSAYDPELQRRVALKVLHSAERNDRRARRLLVNEARAMARLNHPNIMTVYEVQTVNDITFMAMEYVDGQTLSQWCKKDGKQDWREVVATFLQAGRGLLAAHAAGVTHHDFKPSNVLVRHDNHVLVSDFGLARWRHRIDTSDHRLANWTLDNECNTPEYTQSRQVLGTVQYLAPERFAGHHGDERSDQFSFCVAFYEGLYGCRPFSGTNPCDILDAIRTSKFTVPQCPAAVPRWIRRIVLRGLHHDPRQRFPSMRQLLASLMPHTFTRLWMRGTEMLPFRPQSSVK